MTWKTLGAVYPTELTQGGAASVALGAQLVSAPGTSLLPAASGR